MRNRHRLEHQKPLLLEPIDQKVEMVQQYMDLNQQLDSVISRVGKIESSIAQISQSSITQQTLLLETIHKLTENLASVTALLDQQTKM
jgi:two-component sensor histidine kinase